MLRWLSSISGTERPLVGVRVHTQVWGSILGRQWIKVSLPPSPTLIKTILLIFKKKTDEETEAQHHNLVSDGAAIPASGSASKPCSQAGTVSGECWGEGTWNRLPGLPFSASPPSHRLPAYPARRNSCSPLTRRTPTLFPEPHPHIFLGGPIPQFPHASPSLSPGEPPLYPQ